MNTSGHFAAITRRATMKGKGKPKMMKPAAMPMMDKPSPFPPKKKGKGKK